MDLERDTQQVSLTRRLPELSSLSLTNKNFMSRRVTHSVNSLQLLAVSKEQGRQDWAGYDGRSPLLVSAENTLNGAACSLSYQGVASVTTYQLDLAEDSNRCMKFVP